MQVAGTKFLLLRGDITDQDADAIVNAANSSLMGGGGVDGAIHRKGGPAILDECKRIREGQGTCPPGEAVITGAGALKARYVIHAVGPIWSGGNEGEPRLLRSTYVRCLELAAAHAVQTIAFPAISTGAYRYPLAAAAKIALGACKEFAAGGCSLREIRFVLFTENDLEEYRRAAATLSSTHGAA